MKKIIFAIFALPVIAGCGKTELVDNPVPVSDIEIVATVSDTRTSFTEGDSGINTAWVAGDVAGIYWYKGETIEEAGTETGDRGLNGSLSAKSSGATTSFDAPDNYLAEEGSKYLTYVYYPYSESAGENPLAVKFTLPAVQTAASAGDLAHLAGTDFIYAGAIPVSDGTKKVNLQFSHALSALDIALTSSESNLTVSGIRVVADDENEIFSVSEGSVNLSDGSLSLDAGTPEIALGLQSAATLSETAEHFYMSITPGHAGRTLSVYATVNGTEMFLGAKKVPSGGIPASVKAKMAFDVAAQTEAVVRVRLTSTEFAAYSPERLTLFTEPADMVAQVEVADPVKLSEESEQIFDLNVSPGDWSGKDLWLVVEMIDEDNLSQVTIPVRQSDFKLVAGETRVVALEGFSLDDNDASAWYCAENSRYLAGKQLAYGDANTYFIQCKNGSTYTGATYSANADIPESVEIDYRARGDFFKAVTAKPENVSFEWAKLQNGNIYTPRVQDYSASGVVISGKFTINPDASSHKVTVTNSGAYAGTPILLMKDSEGKTLWAWTFWNIAADGTALTPVTVGGYGFAPMDIGQPTTDMATWIANTSGSNPDPIFRMNHLYQWGRPIPIFWTTYWSLDIVGDSSHKGNVPAVVGSVSLVDALANPQALIAYPGDVTAQPVWSTETYLDLWGANSAKEEGRKSIYDPCPKGWRVASRPALDALTALSSSAQFNESVAGMVNVRVGDLILTVQGRQTAKDPSTGTQYRPTNIGLGNAASASTNKEGLIWSNVAGNTQGQGLWYTLSTHSSGKSIRTASFDKVSAASVRCIVDESNR